MDWGTIIVIAGAACLAKSLMASFEWLEHFGAKKDRAAGANSYAANSYTK